MSKFALVKNVTYWPGDEWDCGGLEFFAYTPLGHIVYKEVIPGPRHGDDHAEKNIKFNGKDLSDYDDSFYDWFRESFPDFEAPREAGRWADQFNIVASDEIQAAVETWFEAVKEELAMFLAADRLTQ